MENSAQSSREHDEVITTSPTGMITPTVRLHLIKNHALHPNHPNQQHQAFTVLLNILNSFGYLERNIQITMRYNMPFGDLATLLRTRFDVPEYFGLEMKA
jgi:hypothetical protein